MTSLCQELNSIINCAICENRLKNPVRLVECMHAYCRDCLDRDCVGKKNYKCKVCGTSVNPLRLESESRHDHSLMKILCFLNNETSRKLAAKPTNSKAKENKWICAKLILRKIKNRTDRPNECLGFPSSKFFTVLRSMPVSTLLKLLRLKMAVCDDVKIVCSVMKTSSNVGIEFPECLLMNNLAETTGYNESKGPLNIYVDMIFPIRKPAREHINIGNTVVRPLSVEVKSFPPTRNGEGRNQVMTSNAQVRTAPTQSFPPRLTATESRPMFYLPMMDPNMILEANLLAQFLTQNGNQAMPQNHRSAQSLPAQFSVFPRSNATNCNANYCARPENIRTSSVQNLTAPSKPAQDGNRRYRPILPRPGYGPNARQLIQNPSSNQNHGFVPTTRTSNNSQSAPHRTESIVEKLTVSNDCPSANVLRLETNTRKLP